MNNEMNEAAEQILIRHKTIDEFLRIKDSLKASDLQQYIDIITDIPFRMFTVRLSSIGNTFVVLADCPHIKVIWIPFGGTTKINEFHYSVAAEVVTAWIETQIKKDLGIK